MSEWTTAGEEVPKYACAQACLIEGAHRATLADAEEHERLTGHEIGWVGASPEDERIRAYPERNGEKVGDQ